LGIQRRDPAGGAQDKPGLELETLGLKKLEPRDELKLRELSDLERRNKRPPK
jgi:hypothetical protein